MNERREKEKESKEDQIYTPRWSSGKKGEIPTSREISWDRREELEAVRKG